MKERIGTPRRILVIRRRALGDAVVSLPVVAALRRAWPAARLDLLLDRPLVPLLRQMARGTRVLPWPPDGPWWRRLRAGRYELVVDLLSTPRTALWTAASGARWRVGYDLPWRRWAYNLRVPRNRLADGTPLRQFAAESFQDAARRLGLALPPWRPGTPLDLPDTVLGAPYRRWRETELARRPRPRIGFLLGATWPAKAWPAAHAVATARALAADGAWPLLVPGPGDAAVTAAWREAAPELAVAPPTDLLALADLLGRLDLVVATDNGGRHVAAAVGTPTVTLFGPTDPAGWNPEHPRHRAVQNPVACAPCDRRRCPVAGHPCLDDLAPGTVLAACRDLLSRFRGEGRKT